MPLETGTPVSLRPFRFHCIKANGAISEMTNHFKLNSPVLFQVLLNLQVERCVILWPIKTSTYRPGQSHFRIIMKPKAVPIANSCTSHPRHDRKPFICKGTKEFSIHAIPVGIKIAHCHFYQTHCMASENVGISSNAPDESYPHNFHTHHYKQVSLTALSASSLSTTTLPLPD